MKQYKGYLIDLDGTMYRGNEVIEDAALFLQALQSKGIPYLFLTNNSSKTQTAVSTYLNELGLGSTPEQVFTTSMATAKYIKQQKYDARCYVIGEEGLHDEIKKAGLTITDENADYVVIGIDRDINYEKYTKACLAIRNGAEFISTNSDTAIPTERGLLPGNGALTSVISISTGKQPIFIGKPETVIMQEALKVLGTEKKETLMVGDNYNTDILAGINTGLDTLLVFTGVSQFRDLSTFTVKPTYHVQRLTEWIESM